MESRLQVLVGIGFAITLIATGIVKAHRRRVLMTADGKLDYAYIVKLILHSMGLATVSLGTILTVVFMAAWGMYTGPPGAMPPPLDAFMPIGYAPYYAMTMVAVGTLVLFAASLISFIDHINTGGAPPRPQSPTPDGGEGG